MAQPRVASKPPVACAACYGQYVDRVHIDYASAIEGHQIRSDNPRAPHVDWVVICEDCIRSGYELLPEQASHRDKLSEENARLTTRVAELSDYASRLEDVIARKPPADPASRAAAPAPPPSGPARKPRKRQPARA